ncbi:hypothetical protein [Deinococcus altitudinis]
MGELLFIEQEEEEQALGAHRMHAWKLDVVLQGVQYDASGTEHGENQLGI